MVYLGVIFIQPSFCLDLSLCKTVADQSRRSHGLIKTASGQDAALGVSSYMDIICAYSALGGACNLDGYRAI